MPQFDKDHVKICGCFVVWDAITRPETNDNGKQKWSLKVAIDPNNPDLALMHQLANKTLQDSKWKGVLPNGGQMPIGQAGPNEFNGIYNGWAVMNAGTYRGTPDIYDENGGKIDPMQLGNLLYGGQKVDILVHCYEYDNKAKGIAAGLDAFSIIASAGAPRQQFGSAGIDTSGAFGGGGATQQAAPANTPAAPGTQPQQSTDFLPGGPGAAPPPQEETMYVVNGVAYTEQALLDAGWSAQQIAAI